MSETLKSATRLQSWFEQQTLVALDAEGHIREVSESFAQWVGCQAHTLIGQPLFNCFAVANATALKHQMAHDLRREGFWQGILQPLHHTQPLLAIFSAQELAGETLYMGLLHPVQGAAAFDQRDELRRAEARIAAVERVMASIEFDLSGHIRTANANFLQATGYTLAEIEGQHHRIFMFPEDAEKPDYAQMWQQLGTGQPLLGTFRRRTKDGREIWILGSYNPILDEAGQPVGLVKYVFDVTDQKQMQIQMQEALEELATAEEELRMNLEEMQALNDELERTRAVLASQLAAISRSNAVIEFDLSGHIRTANANFLQAIGYTLDEIEGQHHRLFMFPEDAEKPDYAQMWARIGAGEFVSGTFRRRTKDGREIWILGSYNPILGPDGQPTHAIKYVIDVTKQVQQEQRMQEALDQLTAAEEELRMNLEEMQALNDELDLQRSTSEHLLSDVRASLTYARRIQSALIPDEVQLNSLLPANYRAGVLFQPRDLVSGDFYWIGRWGRRAVLAVGDGTGHGVPGSFMSLIGMAVLQKLVERSVTDPVVLLEEMDAEIRRVLGQELEGSLQDSIEMVICTLDERNGTVLLASAMRPVWQVGADRWVELPASRMPVGGSLHGEKQFQLRVLELVPGETLYLFSDGLQDQFGTGGDPSAAARKWGRKSLQEHILRLHEQPLPERMPALDRELNLWRGSQPQTDDVLCLALEYAGPSV